MRKLLCICLCFALLLSVPPAALAAGPAGGLSVHFYEESTKRYGALVDTDVVKLVMDGATLPTEVPAMVQYIDGAGRTLVPVRLVAERLGATVVWVAENRQVLLLRDAETIVLTLGSATALVNGQPAPLPGGVPAGVVKYQGKENTMVPLRFISEQLGATVGWDNATFTATITSPNLPTPSPTPSASPSPTPGPSPSPSPVLPGIGDNGLVTAVYTGSNTATVEIVTNHTPEFRVVDLGDRVAVDVLGAVHASGSNDITTIPIQNDYITAVRYAQHADDLGYSRPHTLRVVLDLKPGTTYAKNITVTSSGGSVLVTAHPAANGGGDYVPTEPLDPSKRTIALDAGHGGTSSGAVYEGVYEKNLTLAITTKLQEILVAKGFNVVLTRPGDTTVGLYTRCDIANAVNADVFVSIHCNAAATVPTFQGAYTYYHPSSARGSRFATAVQAGLAAATGCIDRGTSSADFAVVRATNMAAVLVETGFMTNHEELMRLCDSAYQQKIAQGVADGIINYLSTVPAVTPTPSPAASSPSPAPAMSPGAAPVESPSA